MTKVDSLSLVSNTKTTQLVTKPEANSKIELFKNNNTKSNVDELNFSNNGTEINPEEKTNNKKKWLIGAGIALGAILTGVLIYKFGPKLLDKIDDFRLKKFSDIDNPKLIEAYESKNFKQMKILEGFSPKEIRTLKLDVSKGDQCFLPTLTGHKPACIIGNNGNLEFISKIKDNPVYRNTFDFCTNPSGSTYVFNKEKVLEVIKNKKEIYTARLGLNKASSVEEVYNALMKNKTEIFGCTSKDKYHDIVGLTLGFPEKSTMMFQLENMANVDYVLRDNPSKYKEVLLKVLQGENSPYKNLSKSSFKELEKIIKEYKPINYESSVYYPFKALANEPQEFARINKAITDFINNFSFKDLC